MSLFHRCLYVLAPQNNIFLKFLALSGSRRHTLSHIDLSNAEAFDDDDDEDDEVGGGGDASCRRQRRHLADSVSCLLRHPGVPVTSLGLSQGHPVVAFLTGTRRSIKRRRRGRLTISNLLRDSRVRIGSMTNLSSSSTARVSPPQSPPCPPPVSCLIRPQVLRNGRAALRLTELGLKGAARDGVRLSASDLLRSDHRFTSMVHVDYPHPPAADAEDAFHSLNPSLSFSRDINPGNPYQNPGSAFDPHSSLPPTRVQLPGRARRQLPKVPEGSAVTERANRLVSYAWWRLGLVLVFL